MITGLSPLSRSGLDERLTELIELFETRGRRLQHNGNYTKIVHHPPFMAWGPANRNWEFSPLQYRQYPQCWQIVYFDRDDRAYQWGAVIGHSRAEVLRWLLEYDRAWGLARPLPAGT